MSTAAAKAQRVATYQDVLDAPAHKVAEVVDGELFLSPRPAMPHSLAASAVGALIWTRWHGKSGGGPERPGGWWILAEPELHLGTDIVVPDLAGWRRDSMPVLPDGAYCTQAPDWLCEVISPATARIDRVYKLRIYARAGVQHLWLVDPAMRSLDVFRREELHWLLVATHVGDEKVRAEPFEALELDLTEWWMPEAAPSSAEQTPQTL